MTVNHKHDHTAPKISNMNKAFIIGIVLNTAFVIIEFIIGFVNNSLALISDAGHNLSDVLSLGLSLLAFKLAKSKATDKFTYGLHKSTIIASLTNAVILLVATGSIGWEAINRFSNPQEVDGQSVAIVAFIGVIINAISALLFFRDKERDLNVKGAYLHLLADALVSVGVVIAGILITFTGIKWIDPLISLVIMAVVIYSTWSLLKESLRLSLDGVPKDINVDEIKRAVAKIEGVTNLHHVHIWAISTTKNAMTAHLVIADGLSEQRVVEIKDHVRHELEHLNIQHLTLETESQPTSEECI